MTYTIIFVVVVVVVSGLIAYLGDLLGRRMGKRRLSLFGLRPKHTAIVMTTITGMVIAFLTIASLLAISSSLRDMFFHAEQLVKDNKIYQIKNGELRDQNIRLSSSRTTLTREVVEKTKQVQSAREEVQRAMNARDAARSRVDDLENKIKIEQAELRDLRETGQLTKAQLKDISNRLKVRVAELLRRKAELREKDTELAQKENDLAAKTRDLNLKIAALDKAEIDIKKAEATINDYEKTICAQKDLRDKLVKTTKRYLTNDVVLPQGQELSRTVVDCTISPQKIHDELISLLDKANSEAKESKAGSSEGGHAIRLVYDDTTSGQWVDNEQLCIDSAVNAIVQQGREGPVHGVLVRVVVVNNTLKGETAPSVLNLYWNHLAFQRGESIASRNVDGKQSEGRILLSVLDLLRQDVRMSAQDKGVVPVAGPDPEKAAQPISEDQLDRVMELVSEIRSQNKRVDVRAVARTDIYQSGPLTLDNIDFTISNITKASR